MLKDLMGGNDILIPEEQTDSLPKQKKIGIFDYINQISSSYQPLKVDNSYSSFLVNKMLSEHIDCILAVGLANRTKFLDKQSHFDFLQKSIKTKTKRYSKKSDKDYIQEISNLLLSILLSKKWECSVRESLLNINFMSEDDKRKYFSLFRGVLSIEFFEENSSYLLNGYTKQNIKDSIIDILNNL